MSHARKSREATAAVLFGFALLTALLLPASASAEIPATPVMTLYDFNGGIDIPYYSVVAFERKGATSPVGTLAQGSSVVPCLVIRGGEPLTDRSGTPYVGFEVVVDARKATRADTERFDEAVASRKALRVRDHSCAPNIKYVMSVRNMFDLEKEPFFDPPAPAGSLESKGKGAQGELDEIVRAFHNSPRCADAGRSLIGRRAALDRAWSGFAAESRKRWPSAKIERARNLDFVMRTALYEGHLDRGCSAYGACERNVVALSIRNRGGGACTGYQGCGHAGDFQGIATKVTQYNIWDEFLTQISGIASCFLREDLSGDDVPAGDEAALGFNAAYYKRIRRMYEQNVADVERILYGDDGDLSKVFPGTPLATLKGLRHYYHPPAMGKCFPGHPRVEYMSGAVAQKGKDFALIANTRIQAGRKVGGGYLFKEFVLRPERGGDVTSIEDNYPGFVVDGRKVSLRGSSKCTPYGVSRSCSFKNVSRHRRTPSWFRAGRSAKIKCSIRDRGEDCLGRGRVASVSVGGPCDVEMQPFVGVK